MANSRSAYKAKSGSLAASTGNITFTPPFGAHAWNVRLIMSSSAAGDALIESKDEDDDFAVAQRLDASGDWEANSSSLASADVTIDSPCKSLKITNKKGGVTMVAKVTAYRTTDDISTGGYSTTDGVS